MNNLIWLVGAVVIVLFVLGYFGLRWGIHRHADLSQGQKPQRCSHRSTEGYGEIKT